MAISDNYIPIRQLGNGVTTQFSALWAMISANYAQVFLEDAVTGVQTLVTQGAGAGQYTIVFDASGFTVTFNTAPTSANYVVIGRSVALDQTVPYRTSSGFQGNVEEGSFDKLTAMVQDLNDAAARSLKFPLGSSLDGLLPTPVDGLALEWDGVAGKMKNGLGSSAIAAATATAVAAAASATSSAAAAAASASSVLSVMTTLGDMLYGAAGGAITRLAGNAAASTRKFLLSAAIAGVATAPAWAAIQASDVSGLAAVATSGAYADLSGKPTLGTLAALSSINNSNWSGTPLSPTNGGTGLSSYAQGDIIYSSAINTLAALGKNTSANRFLSNSGASNNPAWAQASFSGLSEVTVSTVTRDTDTAVNQIKFQMGAADFTWYQQVITGSHVASGTVEYQRVAQYAGAPSAGWVNINGYFVSQISSGANGEEWGCCGSVLTSANGNAVGVYGAARAPSTSTGTAWLWGGVMEATDQRGAEGAYAVIGCEVDISGNGPNLNHNRIGINVAALRASTNTNNNEVWAGLYFSASEVGGAATSYYTNAVHIGNDESLGEARVTATYGVTILADGTYGFWDRGTKVNAARYEGVYSGPAVVVNHVTGSKLNLPAGITGVMLQLAQADSVNAAMQINGFGANSQIWLGRANNTATAPSALTVNNVIGQISWYGYGATGYGTAVSRILSSAAENWNDTQQGTTLTVQLTAPGGTTLANVGQFTSTGLNSCAIGATTAAAGTFTSLTAASIAGLSTFNISDSVLRVQDNGDVTKQFALECSGISAGTVRTWTVPNASDTFAGLATAQTLLNKQLVLNHTAQLATGGVTATSEQFGTDAATAAMALGMFNATAGTQAEFQFYRSKNAAIGSATVVASGDGLGKITWYGAQQTGTFATQSAAAQIRAEVDGTVTSGAGGDMPGRIVFATTADGSSTLTDRLILDNAGVFKPNANDGVALGTTALSYSDLFLASGAVINFNNSNMTITHSAAVLTIGGGNLALGANSLTMTGSLAATGARVTKGWFTDIESTNAPSIGGAAATGSGALVCKTSAALVTPDIGVATGASVALTALSTINATTGNHLPAAGTGVLLQLANADGVATSLEIDGFAASASIVGIRSNGTAAARTATGTNTLFSINACGYDGSAATSPLSKILFVGAETCDASHHGAVITFSTTPLASITIAEAGRFNPDGGLTVGSTTSQGIGTINANVAFYAAGTKVLGTRNTGWANQTAVASKADLGAVPTLATLASWASAVDAMLKAHGITGT